jgi:hypothetical protein
VYFLPRLTLTARLTLLAAVTLLPLAAIAVASHVNEREARREDRLNAATVAAQNYATAIDSFATELDAFMEAAALIIGSALGPITQASVSEQLRYLHSRYATPDGPDGSLDGSGNRLTALFITGLDGRVIAQATGDDTGFDVSPGPHPMTPLRRLSFLVQSSRCRALALKVSSDGKRK